MPKSLRVVVVLDCGEITKVLSCNPDTEVLIVNGDDPSMVENMNVETDAASVDSYFDRQA